ncbi:MAG: hypothetical protein ACREU0_10860 [Burkholderiales bacterium]
MLPVGNLDLARKASEEKKQAAMALDLRNDFEDDEAWVQLAEDYGHRLPNWTYPPEPKTMRRWMRRLKVKEREYLGACEFVELGDFQRLNPRWPLRAWVGLLLEYVDERDEAKDKLSTVGR